MWYHQRKQNRLAQYNYSQQGLYFVTICIKDRWCYFGNIEDNSMILNEYGMIAQRCWLENPTHVSEISLDEFIIMPNHVHGVIEIHDNVPTGVSRSFSSRDVTMRQRCYQKLMIAIGSFKSAVTKQINRQQHEFHFAWQRSYHDRIIRSNEELLRVRAYIADNPLHWLKDQNNPDNFKV